MNLFLLKDLMKTIYHHQCKVNKPLFYFFFARKKIEDVDFFKQLFRELIWLEDKKERK